MPSDHPLNELSNGELAKTMRLAKGQLSGSTQLGENITVKERTHLLYLSEWDLVLRRIN